ncbi:hypothetical protein SAMN05216553_104214 [Lentzea fradiae]|uniref:Alpha amylase inhibitor n=1 Tax=Lentzea fradiae TaxID=200378 RepID=A0A1G7Q4Z8_9PSEU|nr:hypothetical protein [Lentzea fradiae]SDF92690.1 hypothetical protein SAMN05216553_104214 [Lentzea fradiae]
MRGIGACLAAVIAVVAAAAPARAENRCGASYHGDGRTVEVFCSAGQSPYFRAVAHCSDGTRTWQQPGTLGRVLSQTFVARCTSSTGQPRIDGHYVSWA